MFESAEIGHCIDKKTFKQEVPRLRKALLDAQYRLRDEAKTAVVILVNGVDGAGKGETINILNEWMDPHHIRTEAFGPLPRTETLQHPELYRFWQVLPPKGHIGILFGSWYSDPIEARVHGEDKQDRFARRLERIRQFERMLVAEGVVLVKLWFHLSKSAAKARLKALASDPKTAWRVRPQEWDNLKNYKTFIKVSDEALRKTSIGQAPWVVIEGTDPAYRYLTAGRHLLHVLQAHTGQAPQPPLAALPAPFHVPEATPTEAPPPSRKKRAASVPEGDAGLLALPLSQPIDGRSLLSAQDYTRILERDDYERKLEALQGRLNALSRDPRMQKRSLVVVFEGMDAAGKGSTIRRITQALDARFYRVVPVAAPNENERAQPYLWRFWRYIPRYGRASVFDRSWYGRVLVERVEQFCTEADWMRAYSEINEYEEQLVESGVVLVKFWLAITPEEQLRRFEERQNTPHKVFKITDEDWRNRQKWPLYESAVCDMIDRTSTGPAPWHVVASDDKLFVRIQVLKTLCQRLEEALDQVG